MTEIDVHFNAADKVHHACRLLRKAVLSADAKVVVVAEPDLLEALDVSLWQFSPTDFVAHCWDDAEERVASRSPIVLMRGSAAGSLAHREVMVNLAAALPSGFEQFERLIDVVGMGDDERQAGRRRWRHYADRGYAIARHDLSATA